MNSHLHATVSAAIALRQRAAAACWMSAAAWCRRAAAVSGASSIATAAYGAHGLKDVDATLTKAYDNAVKYHQLGSVMLAVASKMPRPGLTGSLFALGTLGFSGSCYAAALSGDRANGRFAPYGGGTLIVAWLTLLL